MLRTTVACALFLGLVGAVPNALAPDHEEPPLNLKTLENVTATPTDSDEPPAVLSQTALAAADGCTDMSADMISLVAAHISKELGHQQFDAVDSCAKVREMDLCDVDVRGLKPSSVCAKSCNSACSEPAHKAQVQLMGSMAAKHGHSPHHHSPHRHTCATDDPGATAHKNRKGALDNGIIAFMNGHGGTNYCGPGNDGNGFTQPVVSDSAGGLDKCCYNHDRCCNCDSSNWKSGYKPCDKKKCDDEIIRCSQRAYQRSGVVNAIGGAIESNKIGGRYCAFKSHCHSHNPHGHSPHRHHPHSPWWG